MKKPRVLIVTPEVTYLPDRMGDLASLLTAKAGGLADVSAALVTALFDQGADVHVALPDYRAIFRDRLAPFLKNELNTIRSKMPGERIHLAEDRAFFYLNRVYSPYGEENIKLSLAFQREVINNIIPRVQPDLIHCNDWMTGLIPAFARYEEIPCLFTIHNVHTVKTTLATIEDRGIDAAPFWHNLFYKYATGSYEDVRDNNPVDFLTSGVFAAHYVNTVSPTFLLEVANGRHPFVPPQLVRELGNKLEESCAVGILNAPDPAFDPSKDENLAQTYSAANHQSGKQANKIHLQKTLGLRIDPEAPVFFWPSRLDPVQKGCHLLADILYYFISDYWDMHLQVVFVADGEYQRHFRDIVQMHQFQDRVAVCDFNNRLEHLGYAAADFVLMPSSFEPCGLPQMIGAAYGALPVVHDTGGLHDTVLPIKVAQDNGNGFVFEVFDSQGLRWALDQAMVFYRLPRETKRPQIERVMRQAGERFTHAVTARQYVELYEGMLRRPLIT